MRDRALVAVVKIRTISIATMGMDRMPRLSVMYRFKMVVLPMYKAKTKGLLISIKEQ